MKASCVWYLKTLEYDGTVWSGKIECRSKKVSKLGADNRSSCYLRRRLNHLLNINEKLAMEASNI